MIATNWVLQSKSGVILWSDNGVSVNLMLRETNSFFHHSCRFSDAVLNCVSTTDLCAGSVHPILLLDPSDKMSQDIPECWAPVLQGPDSDSSWALLKRLPWNAWILIEPIEVQSKPSEAHLDFGPPFWNTGRLILHWFYSMWVFFLEEPAWD